MIVTTTERIEGKRIVQTLGLVSAEQRNLKLPKSFFSKSQPPGLQQAIHWLEKEAEKQGANAIVGTRFAVLVSGEGSTSTLMAYGTAVVVE